MIISLPLWILFALAVYVAWRFMGLRLWHLVLCIALGVLLAKTSAGPGISNLISGFSHWLSQR